GHQVEDDAAGARSPGDARPEGATMNALERHVIAESLADGSTLPSVLRGEPRPDLLRDEVLCEIFAASARRHPEKLALAGPSGDFTYAEVEKRARAIAG